MDFTKEMGHGLVEFFHRGGSGRVFVTHPGMLAMARPQIVDRLALLDDNEPVCGQLSRRRCPQLNSDQS